MSASPPPVLQSPSYSYSTTTTAQSQGCCRVKVRDLSIGSTEESVREFFSFCGDIRLLHLYPSASPTALSETKTGDVEDAEPSSVPQEAVILFETEAGASTAVLLDNAVVDGCRIRVDLFPEATSPNSAAKKSPRSSNLSKDSRNDSRTSLWSEIVSETSNVASELSKSAKSVDERYEISDKVKGAATTVAAATTSAAKAVDDKLRVRENAAQAWSSTKAGLTSLDTKWGISATFSSWFGQPNNHDDTNSNDAANNATEAGKKSPTKLGSMPSSSPAPSPNDQRRSRSPASVSNLQ